MISVYEWVSFTLTVSRDTLDRVVVDCRGIVVYLGFVAVEVREDWELLSVHATSVLRRLFNPRDSLLTFETVKESSLVQTNQARIDHSGP
eukprot:scaffold771_cov170-Amphora_coffeaeformis.AAC.21